MVDRERPADDDQARSALSSESLRPLVEEVRAHLGAARRSGRVGGVSRWEGAAWALVRALDETERMAARTYPGRLGRRRWSRRTGLTGEPEGPPLRRGA
ncbi:MAG: hypothetical protein ACYCXA_09495 [Actinomycetes bacterium]